MLSHETKVLLAEHNRIGAFLMTMTMLRAGVVRVSTPADRIWAVRYATAGQLNVERGATYETAKSASAARKSTAKPTLVVNNE